MNTIPIRTPPMASGASGVPPSTLSPTVRTSRKVPTNSVAYLFMAGVPGGPRALHPPQDEALQVVGLRHAEQHRVIASLHPLLDHRERGVTVGGGVLQHLGEHRFVDVVGAAAGDEVAAGRQQL